MAGLDYLQAMIDGSPPPPPMGQLMRFDIVSAEPGRVVFTCEPDESAYNPIGAVHGGLVCTLLDSVAGYHALPGGHGCVEPVEDDVVRTQQRADMAVLSGRLRR